MGPPPEERRLGKGLMRWIWLPTSTGRLRLRQRHHIRNRACSSRMRVHLCLRHTRFSRPRLRHARFSRPRIRHRCFSRPRLRHMCFSRPRLRHARFSRRCNRGENRRVIALRMGGRRGAGTTFFRSPVTISFLYLHNFVGGRNLYTPYPDMLSRDPKPLPGNQHPREGEPAHARRTNARYLSAFFQRTSSRQERLSYERALHYPEHLARTHEWRSLSLAPYPAAGRTPHVLSRCVRPTAHHATFRPRFSAIGRIGSGLAAV